jgi:hypothetical protein
MNLIEKHLNRENLKAKIYQIDSNCAFTGSKINEGVLLLDVIKDTFTDLSYIKFSSDYMSVESALLMSEVIPRKEKEGFNSLRSYSYFANESELRLMNRSEILDLLLNIPSSPFCIAVSYNCKKHTAFKCIENHNTDSFIITTDLYQVVFNKSVVNEFLPIIQSWYTISKDTAQQPTYFSKNEIEYGNANYSKIMEYGAEKYEQESSILNKYRGSNLFQLIVYLLNKKPNV